MKSLLIIHDPAIDVAPYLRAFAASNMRVLAIDCTDIPSRVSVDIVAFIFLRADNLFLEAVRDAANMVRRSGAELIICADALDLALIQRSHALEASMFLPVTPRLPDLLCRRVRILSRVGAPSPVS